MPRDTITQNTALPLSAVVVIVAFCCAGVGLFWSIKSDISAVRKDMVTEKQMRDWRDDLQANNKELNVPRFPSATGNAAASGNAELRSSVVGKLNEPVGANLQ